MQTALNRMQSFYMELSDFIVLVPHMPIRLRKAILTATRVQREVNDINTKRPLFANINALIHYYDIV